MLIFLTLPSTGKIATGQTCSQMPKEKVKKNKTDKKKKFLGRKDKGKKIMLDIGCTAGREEIVEIKQSQN